MAIKLIKTTGYIFANDEDNLELAHLPLNGAERIPGIPVLPEIVSMHAINIAWKENQYRTGLPPFMYITGFTECALLNSNNFTRTNPAQGQKVWEGVWA